MTKEDLLKIIGDGKHSVTFVLRSGSIWCYDITKHSDLCLKNPYGTERIYVRTRDGEYPMAGLEDIDRAFVGVTKTLESTFGYIGSDPEFFYEKDGVVVPSSEVLTTDFPHVIRDGVQGELNPSPDSCRQRSGGHFLEALNQAIDFGMLAGAELSLKQAVEVPDSVWDRMSEQDKEFGCNPTLNVYKEDIEKPSGTETRLRSAGGHVHISLSKVHKLRHRTFVKLLDIVVGNTLVLIDRDPANKARRTIYGRAGEYRLKEYGVEYRVPSNFWIRHYILWSGLAALVRNAIALLTNGHGRALLRHMDMDKVREAINNNDYELALENYKRFVEYLDKHCISFGVGLGLTYREKFLIWATNKNPLSYFPSNASELRSYFEQRKGYGEGRFIYSGGGFEYFLNKIVKHDS